MKRICVAGGHLQSAVEEHAFALDRHLDASRALTFCIALRDVAELFLARCNQGVDGHRFQFGEVLLNRRPYQSRADGMIGVRATRRLCR